MKNIKFKNIIAFASAFIFVIAVTAKNPFKYPRKTLNQAAAIKSGNDANTFRKVDSFSFVTIGADKDPLNFMVKCNLKLSKQFAKQERKPLLLYVHSGKCVSSRTFTRKIVAKPEFANWANSNFICMEANVTTKKGKEIAKKYGVLKIPSIIMLSFDTDLEYIVEMKLDSESLYTQFNSFLTANTLKSQIELMRETNGLSYRQASVAIAKSYAAQDYKKNPNSVAELMASTKTLRIHKLNNLSEAYIKEYTKLASNNKNEPKSATQN